MRRETGKEMKNKSPELSIGTIVSSRVRESWTRPKFTEMEFIKTRYLEGPEGDLGLGDS